MHPLRPSHLSEGSHPRAVYRGEQYDSDLGLYYLRARYYNPATGRFLSRDSELGKRRDPKSLHRYLYADGDPVNGIDPAGHATVYKPGGGLSEYAGLALDSLNRVTYFVQITLPDYFGSLEGKLAVSGALSLLAATLDQICSVLSCETADSPPPGGPGDGAAHPVLANPNPPKGPELVNLVP